MSNALKSVMEKIDSLTTKEKALAAHLLLVAMDKQTDESVENDWSSLAEARSAELETGKVHSLTWAEIKQSLQGHCETSISSGYCKKNQIDI